MAESKLLEFLEKIDKQLDEYYDTAEQHAKDFTSDGFGKLLNNFIIKSIQIFIVFMIVFNVIYYSFVV